MTQEKIIPPPIVQEKIIASANMLIERFLGDPRIMITSDDMKNDIRDQFQHAIELGHELAFESLHEISHSIEGYKRAIYKRYEHREKWFEEQYPQGLGYMDDGQFCGVNIITKQFLAHVELKDNEEIERLNKVIAERDAMLHENAKKALYREADLRLQLKEAQKELNSAKQVLTTVGETLDEVRVIADKMKDNLKK